MKNSDHIPDSLKEAGKSLPFKVPRDYFDEFPARLQDRIDRETAAESGKTLRFIDYIKPVLGLAAAFAAVFLLVYWPARMVTREEMLSAKKGGLADENIINLVEHMDDHTFFSLLENESTGETMEDNMLETYIAANYNDYDIYLETQK